MKYVMKNIFYKEINEYRCHKYLTFVKKKESIEIDKIINHRINIINERISIYYSYENEITNKNKIILGFVEPNESEIPLNNRKQNITMNFNIPNDLPKKTKFFVKIIF